MKRRWMSILLAASMVCSMMASGAAAEEISDLPAAQEEEPASAEEIETAEERVIAEAETALIADTEEETAEAEAAEAVEAAAQAEEPAELIGEPAEEIQSEEIAEETVDTYDLQKITGVYLDENGYLYFDEVEGAATYFYTCSTFGGFVKSGQNNIYDTIAQVGKPSGTYEIKVTAYNSLNILIAESDKISFTYESKGALGSLKASQYGMTLCWNPVDHADEYWISLYDSSTNSLIRSKVIEAYSTAVYYLRLDNWDEALAEKNLNYYIEIEATGSGYEKSTSNVIEINTTEDFYIGDHITWAYDPVYRIAYLNGNGAMYELSSSGAQPWRALRAELQTVRVEKGITNIPANAFYKCTGLITVTLPSTLTTIGAQAFSGCDILTQISLPDDLTSLGESAFSDCSSLSRVSIPKGLTTIGRSTFSGCSNLIAAELGSGVTSIGYGAFSGCTKLKEINIPEQVTSIIDQAFAQAGAQKVVFNGNIPSIASDAFTDVTAAVYYPKGNSTYTTAKKGNYGGTLNWIENDAVYSGSCGENATWTLNCSSGALSISGTGATYDYSYASDVPWNSYKDSITAVFIDGAITRIGNKVFSGCTNLQMVRLPETLTSIGNAAFSQCSSLSQLRLENCPNLEKIENQAFFACKSLKSQTLPDSVTTIGYQAFEDCDSMETVTIGTGIKSLDMAFANCNKLSSVTFLGNAPETLESHVFANDTLTLYYPAGNPTWTETVLAKMANSSGASITRVPVFDHVHSFSGYVSDKNETCTSDGTKFRFCECGEIERVPNEGSALGHYVVNDAAVAATPLAEGRTAGSHCGRCGEILTAQEAVPKVSASIKYRTYVQTYGWQAYVADGATSGTVGEAKRLEGIQIKLANKVSVTGGVKYRTYCQTYGWLAWSSNGDFNGTKGEAKRLESIQIKLTGEMASQYDVYYRVQAQKFGWLGWAKNGEKAGTQGYSYRLEAIQIKLVPKGTQGPTSSKPACQTYGS